MMSEGRICLRKRLLVDMVRVEWVASWSRTGGMRWEEWKRGEEKRVVSQRAIV